MSFNLDEMIIRGFDDSEKNSFVNTIKEYSAEQLQHLIEDLELRTALFSMNGLENPASYIPRKFDEDAIRSLPAESLDDLQKEYRIGMLLEDALKESCERARVAYEDSKHFDEEIMFFNEDIYDVAQHKCDDVQERIWFVGAQIETFLNHYEEVNRETTFDFVRTSVASPEQYDVFDESGEQIGYVRLKNGNLSVRYQGKEFYSQHFNENCKVDIRDVAARILFERDNAVREKDLVVRVYDEGKQPDQGKTLVVPFLELSNKFVKCKQDEYRNTFKKVIDEANKNNIEKGGNSDFMRILAGIAGTGIKSNINPQTTTTRKT